MPFFCFFCVRSLREACIVISLIYLLLASYHVLWAIYFLTKASHWIFYTVLIISVISIPLQILLFFGAKKENHLYIKIWILFTVIVTFPFCVLLLAFCILEVQIECIFVSLLGLAARGYMWVRVRHYYAQLISETQPDFNNPISRQSVNSTSNNDPMIVA